MPQMVKRANSGGRAIHERFADVRNEERAAADSVFTLTDSRTRRACIQ